MTTSGRRQHWDPGTSTSQDRQDGFQEGEFVTPTLVGSAPSLAQDWLAGRSKSEVVQIVLDGQPLLALLDVQAAEHTRRQHVGVGAITSKALLCGLWMLPTGAPVQADQLPSAKVERFKRSSGVVEESPAGWARHYSPAGVVRALAIVRRAARPALDAASQLPPIFDRWAFADEGLRNPSSQLLARAAMAGVGLARIDDTSGSAVVEAAPAIVGVPGVFRWWIGEVAYAAWLAQAPSTQLSS